MFSHEETNIFPFCDGSKDSEGSWVTVYGDPLQIDQAMAAATSGELAAIIDRCRLTNEDGSPANPAEVVEENCLRLVSAIRKAFSLRPFDRLRGGCTAAMCLRVWNEYVDWQKKNQTPPV